LQIPPLESRPVTATSTAGVLTHNKAAALLASNALPHSPLKLAAAAAANNSVSVSKKQPARPSTATATAAAATAAGATTTMTASAASATFGGCSAAQQRAKQHTTVIGASTATAAAAAAATAAGAAAGAAHSNDAVITTVRQGVVRGVHSTEAHTAQVCTAAQQLRGVLYDVTRLAAVSATAAISIDDLRGALVLRAVNAETAAAAAEAAGTGCYTSRNGTLRCVLARSHSMYSSHTSTVRVFNCVLYAC
jgi:hypothetical protein